MFQQLHQSHQSLEVLPMYEPHRLQHQFLQAAYASVVPMSCRRLATVHQPVSGLRSRDQRLVHAEKGAHND